MLSMMTTSASLFPNPHAAADTNASFLTSDTSLPKNRNTPEDSKKHPREKGLQGVGWGTTV